MVAVVINHHPIIPLVQHLKATSNPSKCRKPSANSRTRRSCKASQRSNAECIGGIVRTADTDGKLLACEFSKRGKANESAWAQSHFRKGNLSSRQGAQRCGDIRHATGFGAPLPSHLICEEWQCR